MDRLVKSSDSGRCWRLGGQNRLRILVLSLIVCFCASAAADQGALAEQLFREGQSLMTEEKYELACPKLAESQRLDPTTGTLLNLAVCHEKAGMLASAWNEYNEVVARAKKDGRQDRVDYAKKRLEEVEPLLSRLTIDVPEAARVDGLTLTFDGTEVRRAAFGVALPVDPGKHEITASAPGKKEWSTHVNVTGQAQQMNVTIPVLEDGPPEPTETQGAEMDDVVTPRENRGRTQRIVGLSLGGVGIVGIGLGSVFGVTAMSQAKKAEDGGCVDEMCPSEAAGDDRDNARTSGTISTIAFAVGGAAAAAGVVLYFTAPPRSADEKPQVAWRARAFPIAGGANVRLEAAW